MNMKRANSIKSIAVTESDLEENRPPLELPGDVVWHLRAARDIFYLIASHIVEFGDGHTRKRFQADCENIAKGLTLILEEYGEEPRKLTNHPEWESEAQTTSLPCDVVQEIRRARDYSRHLANRIDDEMYAYGENREGISLDCDYAGGDLQFILEQYGYAMSIKP